MRIFNSRLTAIAAAVGALCSQSAFALLPTAFDSTEQANNVLRFSGATATDGTTEEIALLATGGLCTAGTASVYRGTNQRAILCTGAGTGLAGSDIAYMKESTAGSENGSTTVSAATAQTLPWLDVFNAAFVCGGTDNNTTTADTGSYNASLSINSPNAVGAAGTLQGYDEYTNCAPTATFTAEAGISDVEAKLFGADGGQGTTTAQFEVIFGVPVTLNLYRALQAAQGITATAACDGVVDGTLSSSQLAGPTTGGTAVPNTGIDGIGELDLPECAPSLSRDMISQIYSGAITSWDQISFGGAALTTFGAAPASNSVYVCRRGNDSGTQRGTQAFFLRQGCGGSDTFRTPTPGGGTVNAPVTYSTTTHANAIVVANASSGDVRNCLDHRDDQNRWAVGVASVDSTVTNSVALVTGSARQGNIGGPGGDAQDTASSTGGEAYQREFRFVRVDGALPSLDAVANGAYPFYTENVCTARTGALAGVEAVIYDRICGTEGISSLSRVAAINETLDNQPWGDGANLLIPGKAGATYTANTLPVSQATLQGNPVGGWNKDRVAAGNNCSTSQPFVAGPYPAVPPVGPVGPEDATL